MTSIHGSAALGQLTALGQKNKTVQRIVADAEKYTKPNSADAGRLNATLAAEIDTVYQRTEAEIEKYIADTTGKTLEEVRQSKKVCMTRSTDECDVSTMQSWVEYDLNGNGEFDGGEYWIGRWVNNGSYEMSVNHTDAAGTKQKVLIANLTQQGEADDCNRVAYKDLQDPNTLVFRANRMGFKELIKKEDLGTRLSVLG